MIGINAMKEQFDKLAKREWKLGLELQPEMNWQDQWTLDGNHCVVGNSSNGLEFQAGPEAGNNAHHGVLWTKESFAGDMKVEFDYTRLDEINRFVCILYFHANGIGEGAYTKDIHEWAHLREEPWMKTYFERMDMLHISFAAFGNDNDEPDDYLRVRRYPVRPDRDFSQIEVAGTVHNTGLFLPQQTYAVTFVKTTDALGLHVKGADKELYHCWDISTVEPTHDGPFGIRHMWQKHACYNKLKIFTAE